MHGRTSAYEYCCKDNLCNDLSSSPLSAFTFLACRVGSCPWPYDGACDSDFHDAYRNSAAEFCGNHIAERHRAMMAVRFSTSLREDSGILEILLR
ncbi:unnamed protein product [Rotaria sp. Silwood1]|nr:unnamed protein product [Rotaria sp. Silwood1]